MEFLPSLKISHADGLSRFILKQTELLEDTVIASLQTVVEVKNTLCYTIRELLGEIKKKVFDDDFMKEIKKENIR